MKQIIIYFILFVAGIIMFNFSDQANSTFLGVFGLFVAGVSMVLFLKQVFDWVRSVSFMS